MSMGRVLLEKGLVSEEQLERAQRRQRLAGGSLADSIVAEGYVTAEALKQVLDEPPLAPETVEATGLDPQFLLSFVLRSLRVLGIETIPDAADALKLPTAVLTVIFDEAKKRHFLEVVGPSKHHASVLRYQLTEEGRARATEALHECLYAGPVPVTLDDYQRQVGKQSVSNERVTASDIARSFKHLVLPQDVLARLGPAVNSGKALLLYGGPGNGKTSVAEALGLTFEQSIWIPYAIIVDGQIIKVFDPGVHEPVAEAGSSAGGTSLFRDATEPDPRWVRCRRPVVMTGGELTLEMLDLSFDSGANFYEAPAHIKATGGIFIIDDFGRQRMRSMDLVNRWILPLELRHDYLSLSTGQKIQLPFDEFVVFSTNFPPEELMDEAGLRRIPYKIEVAPPAADDYVTIFKRVCEAYELTLHPDVLSYLLEDFYPATGSPLGGFHPKFIVEHVVARCRYEGVPSALSVERVYDALRNLVVGDLPSAP
jgi:hypothetical protein